MTEASATKPAIELRNLRFRYPSEGADSEWVVDIESLSIQRGEQWLLRGRSGCGKSTLLHLICGLISPTDGSVCVSGKEVHAMSGAMRDAFRSQNIGVIFQEFNLLEGFSAIENVMMAMLFSSLPRKEHESRARALLEQLGIDAPHRDPARMSVGQRQRVAVARALACEPVVVLADEPTASLDPETGDEAITLIQSACAKHNAALLCVSHDPALEEYFDHHVYFESLSASASGVS